MGVSLDLYISDGSEEPQESLAISKRFYEQVVCDWKIIYDASEILTKEEKNLIRPNEYGQINIASTADLPNREAYLNHLQDLIAGKPNILSLDEYLIENKVVSEKISDRERDPLAMLGVLRKIEAYIRENIDTLPLIHDLYEAKDELGNVGKSISSIEVGGIKACVEGDLYFEDDYASIRKKIRLKSYSEDFGKVNLYVDVKPEIEIEGKVYFCHTRSVYQLFEQEFTQIYTILEQAIEEGKKVLWEYL